MKQREKYTKSGQTGSEGGILWAGDITNDETNRRGKERRFLGYITQGRRQLVPGGARAGLIVPPPLSPCQQPAFPSCHFTSRWQGKKNQAAQYLRKRLFLSLTGRNIDVARSDTKIAETTFQDRDTVSTWKTHKRVQAGGRR